VFNEVARAARNIGDAAGDLHRAGVVANLDRASGDLAAMTASVRAGQGTIGALLADPTIYEQLVTVLGGVARSRILRALVRYAIGRSSEQEVGRVVDGAIGKAPPITPLPPLPPLEKYPVRGGGAPRRFP
jgi:phospholipid/cholesterol/gamma-HCH transport system substrate-binding protein